MHLLRDRAWDLSQAKLMPQPILFPISSAALAGIRNFFLCFQKQGNSSLVWLLFPSSRFSTFLSNDSSFPLALSQGFLLLADLLFSLPKLSYTGSSNLEASFSCFLLSAPWGGLPDSLVTPQFLGSCSFQPLIFLSPLRHSQQLPWGPLITLVWALGSQFLFSRLEGELIPMSTSIRQGFHF